MRKHDHADSISDDLQTLALVSLPFHAHIIKVSHVWFSPLGLRNHEATLKRQMNTSPMIRLHLSNCQHVASSSESIGKSHPFAMVVDIAKTDSWQPER